MQEGSPPFVERRQAGAGPSPAPPVPTRSTLSRIASWVSDLKVIVGTLVVLVAALITSITSALHYFAKTRDLQCIARQAELKDNLNTAILQENVLTDTSKAHIELLEQASARLEATARGGGPEQLREARKELADARTAEARSRTELDATRARRLALEEKVRHQKPCIDSGGDES